MTLIGIINIWRSDANNRFGHQLSPSADTWLDTMLTWQSDDAPGASMEAVSKEAPSKEEASKEAASKEEAAKEAASKEGALRILGS